jgi:hypothetical protein
MLVRSIVLFTFKQIIHYNEIAIELQYITIDFQYIYDELQFYNSCNLYVNIHDI